MSGVYFLDIPMMQTKKNRFLQKIFAKWDQVFAFFEKKVTRSQASKFMFLGIAGILLGGIIFFLPALLYPEAPGQTQQEWNDQIVPPSLCYESHCFSLEIADTDEKKQIWLMGRTELGSGQGMLFVFSTGWLYPFWMKNTLIPLDILWLDADFRVVAMREAVPCLQTLRLSGTSLVREENNNICPSYRSSMPALYVLEIAGGMAQQLGIGTGVVFSPLK